MKYQNGSVSDLKIAYIGGGSRGWAWGFMADLAMEPELNGTVRLYDIDAQAAKNNETIGNHLSSRPEVKSNWKYETASSLKVALTDADFVIISILPGTFDEMASDVHLPERLGIYQSVGDTAGPGGMIRALRTIPMFVEIAQAIKAYSPNAWVINYTNPMTLCVKTLYHVFPKIKVFGCCHEVFGTQKVLKGILEKSQGLENVKRSDIHVNVLGINHFTWFDYASYQGMDLMPIYRDYVEEHFEEGFDEQDKNWANSTFECAHRVKFDLFRKYGLIAAAGDRHLAEFMPGNEYLKDPETVTSWKFGLTTVDWRKTDLEKRLERSKKLVSGEEEMKLDASGEEGILLIKALCGLTRVVSNVNIPNTSKQITNLPSTAVVETNAVFERDSIRPVIAGTLPKEIHDLIAPHVENHEDILKASLNYDKDLVIRAFLNDPLIKDRCSKEEVALLVRDMIKATLAYLPKEWKELI
jgi:alpha-galactosidase